MGLLNRARDALFGRAKKAPRLSSHTIDHRGLDEYICRDVRQDSEVFEGFMSEPLTYNGADGPTDFDGWEQLKEDAFFSYHTSGNDARTIDDERLKPNRAFAKKVMDAFIQQEEHSRTRALTKNDRHAAACSTIGSIDALAEGLQEHEDKLRESDELQAKEDEVCDAQDLLEQLRDLAREQHQREGEVKPETVQQIRDAVGQRDQRAEALADAMEHVDEAGQQAAARAIAQQAAEAGQELGQAYGELAGLDPGRRTDVPADQAIELAKKWRDNAFLAELLMVLGRFRRDYRTQRAKRITGGREEPIGIEVGNDLSKVLVSQKVRLRHPILKRAFYKDYANRELLQLETRGEEEAGRGPVVLIVDFSYSMNEDEGARRKWAVATALAVMSGAHRERRDVHVIGHNATVVGEWSFPGRGDIDLPAVTNFAECGPSGGTNITVALRRGARFITTAPAFKSADMLVISDGESRDQPAGEVVAEQLRATGVRIHGVMIGAHPTSYLRAVCDDTVSVFDLAQPSEANKHIAQAIT